LALILKTFSPDTHLDLDGYRHLIGFVLVGIIIAGSVNAVATTLQRLSKSSGLSPSTYALAISWSSSTYFISTAVMLRSNLPEKYVGGIGNALGTSFARGIFEVWFDAVFFLVAGVTALGLFIAKSWSDESLAVDGKEV
jgi:Abscisic acid G-protein coupled receptor